MQHHAEHVGCHDPIMRIDIHFVEPAQRLGRTHPREEEKIPEHHEPLDVVIIPRIPHLPQALPETIHLRLPRVEKIRQGPLRLQTIDLLVVRHLQPIDAIDEFPPPRDLPDKPLHTGQGRRALFIRRDRPLDTLPRRQQPQIEQRRDHRVEKQRVTLHHEILPRTKPRQPHRHEMLQPPQRPGPIHRQPESLRRARIAAKLFLDHGHHFFRDPVRLFRQHLGHRTPRLRPITKRLPVLLVEIPPVADRLAIRLHEKPELRPHPPVMRLHEERLLPLGPRYEILPRHEELPRRHDLERKLLGQFLRRGLFVIIVRRGKENALRLVLFHVRRQRRLPSHPAPETMLIHRPPLLPPLLRKMPLRRNEQNQPLLMIRQLFQPPLTLDQKQNIRVLPRPRQRRIVRPQLVAKNPNRPLHRINLPHPPPPCLSRTATTTQLHSDV